MPSTKPNGSIPSRSLVSRQRNSSNASSHAFPVEVFMKASSRPGSAKNITTRCGTLAELPQSHCEGALLPTSPRRRERLSSVIPARNSEEKPERTEAGTPSALRPVAVKATCNALEGGGSVATALVIGALRNQDRAAATSLTLKR